MSSIPLNVKHCCSAGQAVLKRDDVCWEPISNMTSKLDLSCKNVTKIFKYFKLSEDGHLNLMIGENNYQEIDYEFCMGNVTNINDVRLAKTRLAAVICTFDQKPIVPDSVMGYCMLVSVVFLALTALIYAVLPELRDLQGKSIINFCCSFATGLAILAIMRLIEYSDMDLCAVRGFLGYFFLIAAFFWTNAISIQILVNIRRPSIFDYSWSRFTMYAIYAWGCPVVLTVCMAIVNFHPYIDISYKPGIGLMHCWFFDVTQQWYYLYSVMTLLIAVNIGIFIYTSVMLCRVTRTSSHIRALRYRFVMSVRLIVLMGLPWVFEMIGSLSGRHIIWTILDVFNVLQGFLIFLLLVIFRRRVIKAMYKHGWLKCISRLVEKYLAVRDDEEYVVEHTDVPMTDTIIPNGRH